ncbi:hypothetical protein OOU_Y34scaffold00655g10 [Pyricularia oryzae Y34]|uniref:Uncharacterized protein n=1 Tax=Pyricularia oryzae (strain Y34) TaxID=1143189 RepID=A0AA97PJ21_PYRO3|nr:hypothetical protein OOU_Y34scaffold00655g10 [Pyricularia oryzae Y34]
MTGYGWRRRGEEAEEERTTTEGRKKEEVQKGKEDVEVIRSKELEDNWDEEKGLDEIGPGLTGLC